MNCKQCDTLLPEGSVFCQTCGLKAGVTPTVNGGSGNLLERFKSYGTLKKVLIIGTSAIVLFFVYVGKTGREMVKVPYITVMEARILVPGRTMSWLLQVDDHSGYKVHEKFCLVDFILYINI